MPNNFPSLALGTAQFGLPYGITNMHGQLTPDESRQILSLAHVADSNMVIDTAPAYGNSERVLGGLLHEDSFHIVTKTDLKEHDPAKSIEASLQALNKEYIYGFLDHNAHNLLGPDGRKFFKSLETLKSQGVIKKIGASVYNANEINKIMQMGDIDIVQIPLNILDQRLINSGTIDALRRRNIEIHVRSAFLQGILLNKGSIPNNLQIYKDHLDKFWSFCERMNITPLQATLGFLKQQSIDHVIIGVSSLKEWSEIIDTWNHDLPELEWGAAACPEEILLNPALWPKAS